MSEWPPEGSPARAIRPRSRRAPPCPGSAGPTSMFPARRRRVAREAARPQRKAGLQCPKDTRIHPRSCHGIPTLRLGRWRAGRARLVIGVCGGGAEGRGRRCQRKIETAGEGDDGKCRLVLRLMTDWRATLEPKRGEKTSRSLRSLHGFKLLYSVVAIHADNGFAFLGFARVAEAPYKLFSFSNFFILLICAHVSFSMLTRFPTDPAPVNFILLITSS
jgi:hypothetical protein